MQKTDTLQPMRCSGCHQLLAKFVVTGGATIEIKCHRCGAVNALQVATAVGEKSKN